MTHRCKHVDAIKAELQEAGATDIAVTQDGKTVRIAWALHGRPCAIVTAAHPRDPVNAENTCRQRMRRAVREHRTTA